MCSLHCSKACPASACSLLLLQYPATAAAARWSHLHLRLPFFLADAAGGESGRAVGGESTLKRDLGVLLTSLLWFFRGRENIISVSIIFFRTLYNKPATSIKSICKINVPKQYDQHI